jgi:anti-sigma factor ChrR (cupin superfamily)
MNTVSIDANKLPWQPAPDYPGEAQKKVLSEETDTTPRTILLRIPAGWRMDAHSHRFTELHYVLEGEYESEGVVFPAGTFRMIPKEMEHGPFSSGKGAVVLITWCGLRE